MSKTTLWMPYDTKPITDSLILEGSAFLYLLARSAKGAALNYAEAYDTSAPASLTWLEYMQPFNIERVR